MAGKKQSILYTLSRHGKDVGWLLGTMHVRDNRAFTHLSILKEYILKADVYVGETDLDELAVAEIDTQDIKPLDAYYSKKKFDKLAKKCLQVLSIDLHAIKHLSPMSILTLMTYQALSEDRPIILDQALWAFAKENSIPTRGLESVDEQRTIYNKIPIKWQLKQLKDLLSNLSKFRKSTKKLADLYQQIKVNKLYKLGKKQLGGMRKLLLYDRNKVMADRIAKYSEETANHYFVSVGIAHLPGEKGILRLLAKHHIKYKAIDLNN